MKIRDKILISLLAGLLAATMHSAPMWWGVLFAPMTREITTASLSEDGAGWLRWEIDGMVLRFRSLDLLFSLLHG